MSSSKPIPEPPFDHFGVLAPFYEWVISPPDPERLAQLLQLQPEHRMLDVGGGTGRVAQHFRGQVRHLCLLDASVGMLAVARDKGGLCTCQGHSEVLPFAPHSFERVLAVDSFHHFRNHPVVVRELVRVLTPGGRMVIEEPNIRYFGVKLVALGEWLALMRSRFFKPGDLARLFDGLGVKVTLYTDPPPNYWVVVEKE